MSDIDRRLESELRRGHPEEDRHRPPAWEVVRARRPASFGSTGLRQSPGSALVAASVTVAVLLVAALTVGIVGGLRADRAAESVQPPSPSVVAVAPLSPTPGPSPTGPAGPLSSAGVDCRLFAADVCARVVAEVSSLEGVPIASASLRYYSRNCIRTGECAATPIGDKPPVRLVGRTTAGASVDWFCSQDPAAPNCAITPEADRQPVSTLRVRFEGKKPQSISLRAADGGFSRSVSPSDDVLMTAGAYVLGATIQCTDCPAGQRPPMCDSRFDAPGGSQVNAVVNVTPGEGCTVNVGVTVAGVATCAVTVSPSPARVGQTVRIEASGLTANSDGSGLAGVRQDGKPVALYFSPNGTFTRTFVAGRRLAGQHEVQIFDPVSGCRAQTTLTVVP
jgi:hypothetical protein